MDSESINLGASPSLAALRRSAPQGLRPLNISDEGTERSEVYIMHFVYILECNDKSLYVGCTNNLKRRVKQHNNSKSGAHYTKLRRPVLLKYSEEFPTLILARRREAEIKRWPRIKKLNLVK